MRCIFHIPIPLDPNARSASGIRPQKMIQAFRNIGYEVDVVSGDARERKRRIKEIKNNIEHGVKYDFLYAESSTMPTLLTQSHHCPTHPFLDFGFLRYCKRKGIKIGLFYRDIYWKFDIYKEALPWWKSTCAIICYEYDLKQYGRLLDTLYLPTPEIYKYIQSVELDKINIDILPPGCDDLADIEIIDDFEMRDFYQDPLHIFYVGGISGHYRIEKLIYAVKKFPAVKLTICCRNNEWLQLEEKLREGIGENIRIIHKNHCELEPYYKEADICSDLIGTEEYIKIAMQYKTFEYLAHNKPILATEGTAVAKFVEENDIGWVVKNDEDSIRLKLEEIVQDAVILQKKKDSCVKAKVNNTWEKRAQKVADDLR